MFHASIGNFILFYFANILRHLETLISRRVLFTSNIKIRISQLFIDIFQLAILKQCRWEPPIVSTADLRVPSRLSERFHSSLKKKKIQYRNQFHQTESTIRILETNTALKEAIDRRARLSFVGTKQSIPERELRLRGEGASIRFEDPVDICRELRVFSDNELSPATETCRPASRRRFKAVDHQKHSG